MSDKIAFHIKNPACKEEGYCAWRGIYPSDHIDSAIERSEIIRLAKIDPKKYMQEMKEWANRRMERLSREGWRKANEGGKVLA